MTIIQEDERWMQVALRMALRAYGNTAENPAVGCVLVKHQQMIAAGWTQPSGRPHAEAHALASATHHAQGATAYVTLEPCAHTGKTPPCAEALVDAKVARVVIGCTDKDSRVMGKGIAMLERANIQVTHGIMQQECTRHHAGFFRRITKNLPEITVKIATSQDEKITTGTASPWITGALSRAYGHGLRATHDAIVTGIGTVLTDNPMLNCRLQGREHHSPIRVVLDRHARLPIDSFLVQTAHDIPVWVLCAASVMQSDQVRQLQHAGIECIALPAQADFHAAMRVLAGRGINRALIEGGQMLTHAALASGIASTLCWFVAPHLIGEAGLSALPQPHTLLDYVTLSAKSTITLGDDAFHMIDL
jgi:diaminohydroxyphosphoribosylaminopyrimidine deaminase / 5-amino-6-(5-phosphoribosylamino)uracil reductase